MDIAGFSPLDETQEGLPKDASAPELERMARADSVRNAIANTMMERTTVRLLPRTARSLRGGRDLGSGDARAHAAPGAGLTF